MRTFARCFALVSGLMLASASLGCSSDGSSADPGQQDGADDGSQDGIDGKADMSSSSYPKPGTYVTTTPEAAQPGEIEVLTLSTGKTFHAKFAPANPKDSAKDVSGTFKFTSSGSTKYLRLFQKGVALARYGWKLDSSTLKLRLVNTSNWVSLSLGKSECGGFVGSSCPTSYRCVDIPADGCDPLNGGADCSGICVADLPVKPSQKCGGIAGLQCAAGQKCIDDPNDGCDPMKGGADCMGVCVGDISTTTIACGGIAGLVCPGGLKCEDDPNDGCDPASGGADCMGRCVADPAKVSCGGFAGKACPTGEHCEDDPSDSCDPMKGGADCMGMCVADPAPTTPKMCGGFANFPCATGYSCVDNPDDSCDPANGGADCPGMCVPAS